MGCRFLGFLLLCFFIRCHGVLLSSLPRTIVVTASPKQGQVLNAGADKIDVAWYLNTTDSAAVGSEYKTVKVKLCYAPESQADRGWRKTQDNLEKDRTCQFLMMEREVPVDGSAKSSAWRVGNDVPTAAYFVRAYAYDSGGVEVAYGQSTDEWKTSNLFRVQGITGQHRSIDVAAAVFSAFSILSLLTFFSLKKAGTLKV